MIVANKVYVEFLIKGTDFFSLKKSLINFFKSKRDRSSVLLPKYALNDISFEINKGDKVAIFGQNGSGKSTLLRLVAGIFEATEGQLMVLGSVSSLIDSSFGLELDATGYENIYYRLLLSGASKSSIEASAQSIIDFSELEEVIHQPIRSYSSGMQMRLSFAIATEISSDILVIDEWLSVGDSKFNMKAQSRMASIIESAKVLLLASHSKELLQKTCNRFFYMNKGRLSEITRVEFDKMDF